MKETTRVHPVQVTFSFTGTFFIKAGSKAEACRMAERDCGLVLGGQVHSSLPSEDVDWVFPSHPDKTVKPVIEGELL